MAARPTPATPPGPADADTAPSLEAVEQELHTTRWHLGFAPTVEARFEADQGPARARGLVISGLIALLVYDLFLFNDLMVRPEVLHEAIAWRLGCLTVYGLAVLALVRRGLPPAWREAAMASTVVVAVAASGMILWHTRSAAATYDLFVFSLIFMAGNIVFPLRFRPALASSLLAFGVASGFALAHPGLPAQALPFQLGLLAGTAVFTVLACYRIERAARQSYLLALREELRAQAAQREAAAFARLSLTDALTLLPNRRAFDEALQRRWAEALRQQRALAVLLIDIDHFKRFNDRHGHPAGDACLQRVAAALQAHVRESDFVARLGGEEFVVLLPAGSPARAHEAAERLRLGVQALAIPHEDAGAASGPTVVTISLGIALARPQAGGDPAALVAQADLALYAAKRAGRNRCAIADAAASPATPPDATGATDSRGTPPTSRTPRLASPAA